MPLNSRLVSLVDQGHILDITLEDLDFRVYIALRDADVEEVAKLVPAERFEQGEVHVMAINDQDDAPAQIQDRSEEHTSELQSLMRISYAVFCLKKKKQKTNIKKNTPINV